MAKSKKNGKTAVVDSADIVTQTDEVLSFPERHQEIQEIPEPEKTQPVNGFIAAVAGAALLPFEPDTDEQKPFLGVFATEAHDERIPRDGSLTADLENGTLTEAPAGWFATEDTPDLEADDEEPEPTGSFCGDLPPEELPFPELQEKARADIEAEHAGITLADTDILADTPNLQTSDPEECDSEDEEPDENVPARPVPRGSDYVPPVGSWWILTTKNPYAVCVSGLPKEDQVPARDYIRENGTLFQGVTKIPLEDFRTGILFSVVVPPEWVISTGYSETKKDPQPGVRKPIGDWLPTETAPSEMLSGAREVANELGVDVRDVQLLVDSALRTAASVFGLKSISSCSPVIRRALLVLNSPEAIPLLGKLLSDVFPVVGAEKLQQLEARLDTAFNCVWKSIRENESKTRTYLESGPHVIPKNFTELSERLSSLEKRFDGLVGDFDGHVARCSAPDVVSDDGITSDAVFQLIQRELNPIRENMASLQDRQDAVERKRLILEDQKRKNQKAHHESMRKPKAEQLEVRRARDKTARELKTVEAEKVGEIKRGRGRPKKVDAPSKPTDKPAAKPVKATVKPLAVPVDLVAGMMKKSQDKKVEKLLRGLDAKQLKRISDQFPKGLPDVSKIPGWVEADRFAFVRWYFGQSGN